jgi:hypothetical protein
LFTFGGIGYDDPEFPDPPEPPMLGQLCWPFGAVPWLGAGVEEPGVELGDVEVVCAEATA